MELSVSDRVLGKLNGEGGIRTHEGVTPTRFRVVRNQPDSATSPHVPRTCNNLRGRLSPGPGSAIAAAANWA